MIRWSYVLPRLLALVLVLLAAHYGLPPLLRWGLERALGSVTRTDVQLAQVWSSPARGEVRLGRLQMARHHADTTNILEFDSAHLQVDLAALTRQRYVIDQARIQGLRLHTPHTPRTAAELEPATADGDASSRDPAGDALRLWLAQAASLLQRRVEDQFESVALARQLADRWPQRWDQLQQQAQQLQHHAQRLRDNLQPLTAQPQLSAEAVRELQQRWQEAQALRHEIDALRMQITQLPAALAEDRQTLELALQQDQDRLRDQLQLVSLSGQQLTDFLLRGDAQRLWNQLEPWLEFAQWFTASPEWNQWAGRGQNIDFVDHAAEPNYLIRLAHLDGQLQVAGHDVDFVGRAHNLRWPRCFQTTEIAAPVQVDLITQGPFHAQLQATFDRVENVSHQRLVLRCDDLPLPGRSWGDEHGVAVAVAPSRVQIQALLTRTGDQFTGRLRLTQQHLELSVTAPPGTLPEPLLAPLAAGVRELDQLDVLVELERAGDTAHWRVHSDLGRQLEQRWRQAAQQVIAEQAAQLTAEAQQQVSGQLAWCQQQLAQQQAELQQRLGLANGLLADLPEPVAARIGSWSQWLQRF